MNSVRSPLPRSSGRCLLSKIRARCAKPHLLRPCRGTDFSGPVLGGFGRLGGEGLRWGERACRSFITKQGVSDDQFYSLSADSEHSPR